MKKCCSHSCFCKNVLDYDNKERENKKETNVCYYQKISTLMNIKDYQKHENN